MPRNPLLCSTIACVLACGAVGSAADPEPARGFERGKSMPFHVVDFIDGEGPPGGGCPSVMISNARSVGVEIWSRSNDDAAFQLASELQKILPDGNRPNVFLVLFSPPPTESVATKLVQHKLDDFFVCIPRRAHRDIMDRADPESEYTTLVFVEHRKVVKAVWRFAEGELTDAAVTRVLENTRALVREAP